MKEVRFILTDLIIVNSDTLTDFTEFVDELQYALPIPETPDESIHVNIDCVGMAIDEQEFLNSLNTLKEETQLNLTFTLTNIKSSEKINGDLEIYEELFSILSKGDMDEAKRFKKKILMACQSVIQQKGYVIIDFMQYQSYMAVKTTPTGKQHVPATREVTNDITDIKFMKFFTQLKAKFGEKIQYIGLGQETEKRLAYSLNYLTAPWDEFVEFTEIKPTVQYSTENMSETNKLIAKSLQQKSAKKQSAKVDLVKYCNWLKETYTKGDVVILTNLQHAGVLSYNKDAKPVKYSAFNKSGFQQGDVSIAVVDYVADNGVFVKPLVFSTERTFDIFSPTPKIKLDEAVNYTKAKLISLKDLTHFNVGLHGIEMIEDCEEIMSIISSKRKFTEEDTPINPATKTRTFYLSQYGLASYDNSLTPRPLVDDSDEIEVKQLLEESADAYYASLSGIEVQR